MTCAKRCRKRLEGWKRVKHLARLFVRAETQVDECFSVVFHKDAIHEIGAVHGSQFIHHPANMFLVLFRVRCLHDVPNGGNDHLESSSWLDRVIDALLAFHFAHPAFHILLSIPAPSIQFASLADALPQELQTRIELGFQIRAPHLSPTQRRLSATMTVQFFKAVLRLLLQAEEAERRLLVRELKTALHRYLEPLLG
jgi:hypothetical protein